MVLSTLIVQLDVDAPATPRLTFALELARRLDAKLLAFCAAEVRLHLPYETGGSLMELQKGRAEEVVARMKALHQEFLDIAGDGDRASWIRAIGDPTQLLALHAREADLLVVGTPGHGVALETDHEIDLGKLVLSTGRPLLVAAEDLRPLNLAKVLVAWKDTREARRAVADAMPLLREANEVVVATLVETSEAAAREGCRAVVRHLMRSGVRAREQVVTPERSAGAAAIADLAREIGADVVVAGAYGHSRIREWAFGGVTRSLLMDGSLHRLVSN